jgi:hypothetical protein
LTPTSTPTQNIDFTPQTLWFRDEWFEDIAQRLASPVSESGIALRRWHEIAFYQTATLLLDLGGSWFASGFVAIQATLHSLSTAQAISKHIGIFHYHRTAQSKRARRQQ